MKIFNREIKGVKKFLKYKLFAPFLPRQFYFAQPGFCPCCENKVLFFSTHQWLRDHFLCNHCFSIPRERAIMVIIEKYFPNWRELNIHESSPGNRGASLTLKNKAKNYVGSQYYPHAPFGEKIGEYYNQDLEKQTFADGLFDIVVTQDVMEHLYDPAKAFAEIARTLKPGGAHIFSVPIINRHKPSEVWATKGENGQPIFLHEEEWHGNPIDQQGSPVTMHWGFDIVDFIKQHSGLETTIEYIDDLSMGIRAEFIEILVSRKN